MKYALLLAAALSAATPAFTADSYTIDPRHAYPVFEINHLGFSTQRGRFNKTTGKIVLDAAARTGSVEVEVDAASIDMGLDKWDEHMRSDEFFDVARHPTIRFRASAIAFDGDRPVSAQGELTLLGVTRPVRLAVSGFRCGIHPVNKRTLCGADVATTIRRSEFGMTKYVPAVGDEVKILVPVEAYRD